MLPRLYSPSLLELPLPASQSPGATVVGQNSLGTSCSERAPRSPELLPETELRCRRPPLPFCCPVTARFAIQEENRENLLLLIFILALERQITVLSRLG